MKIPISCLLDSTRRNLLHMFIVLATSEKPVAGRDLAIELDVSLSSIEIYMHIVKEKNYISGMRGPTGGYVLDVEPKDITVIDIIGVTIVLEDEPFAVRLLSERTVDFLDGITLKELVEWDE